jgi:CBS-domain-containing membrane protein
MRVQDVMTRQTQACRPEDTLERAAQLMWDHDCGCLPVCTGGTDGPQRTVGMITDRDICMNALFQRKSLHELRVSDAMARDVWSCQAGDSLVKAERTMQQARVRRLPVLDDRGDLIGVISLADLALEASRQRRQVGKEITETEVGDTLAAICESSRQATSWSSRALQL